MRDQQTLNMLTVQIMTLHAALAAVINRLDKSDQQAAHAEAREILDVVASAGASKKAMEGTEVALDALESLFGATHPKGPQSGI